jgi:protein transport protein SEC31
VLYILASASNTGYCVVWDLREKREVVALCLSGGGAGMGAQGSTGPMGGMMIIASNRWCTNISYHILEP